MTQPIAYTNIVLHCKKKCPSARLIRRWLEDNDVEFVDLEFEDPTEDLKAITTWFQTPDGAAPYFGDMPVLTYNAVLWRAPDGSDQYEKVKYAVSSGGLPHDFAEKANK